MTEVVLQVTPVHVTLQEASQHGRNDTEVILGVAEQESCGDRGCVKTKGTQDRHVEHGSVCLGEARNVCAAVSSSSGFSLPGFPDSQGKAEACNLSASGLSY